MPVDPALQEKAARYEALKLECNLMIFHRSDCECSSFWARNGQRLIPEIMDEAEKKMLDPLEFFCNYAQSLHARHKEDGVLYT